MVHLSIVICRKDKKDPAFPQVNPENFGGNAVIEGASILEAGMTSGKTSIGFLIKTEDGKYIMAQTSAAILDGLWHALQGAEQNWRENPL